MGKIPEKYTWRSSSLVNQQVESLQKLTLFKLLKLKEHIDVPVSGQKHYVIETKEN